MKNRIAVITGAAGGMGRAIAHQLAQQRCAIVAVDINPDGLEALGSELASLEAAPQFLPLACDLVDADDIE